jgi:ACS family glucarate transporter-like MFS transporter
MAIDGADQAAAQVAPGSLEESRSRPTRVRFAVLGAACALAILTYIHRAGFQSISTELLDDLRMNTTHLSYMTVAFMVAYGLFEVPWGRLGDARGARGLLLVVVLGGSLLTAGIGLVEALPAILGVQLGYLLAARFLFGMFQAGTFPILSRVMADWMPSTERGRAQGLIWMSARTGAVLAPLLIVPLFQRMRNWRDPLVVGAALGVLWCLAVLPWFRNRPEQMPRVNEAERRVIERGRAADSRGGHGRAPWGAMLRSTNVWALWLMYGFLGFSGNFFLFLFANYLEQSRHIDKDTTKWLTVVPFACGVFACVSGGALSDVLMKRLANRRLGRRLVGGLGLTLAGAAILPTPWVNNVVLLGVLYGVTFLGNDLAMGPAWAAAGDIGERHAGSVAGAMNMVASLMAALAALMAGRFFLTAQQAGAAGDASRQHFYLTLPFLAFAASYWLGALCWLRIDVTEPVPQGPD